MDPDEVVSNSVSLIHMFKSGAEGLLKGQFKMIWIAPKVFDETVIRGKEKKFADAFRIEQAIGDYIEVKELDEDYRILAQRLREMGIGPGEAETIALAKMLDVPAILDDKNARKAAQYCNIRFFGTLLIIYDAIKTGSITPNEAKYYLKQLVNTGFRISIELYSEFVRLIEEMEGQE